MDLRNADERELARWEGNDGPGQCRYFARLALDHLPVPLHRELARCNVFVDWGCATGEGTAELKAEFPRARVVGVDVSEARVRTASQRHESCSFRLLAEPLEMRTWAERPDVVFTSNTLEHVEDPRSAMRQLVEAARRYVVILVPWMESLPRVPDHVYTFSEADFPRTLEGSERVLLLVLPPSLVYWGGEQALGVYRK